VANPIGVAAVGSAFQPLRPSSPSSGLSTWRPPLVARAVRVSDPSSTTPLLVEHDPYTVAGRST